MMKEEKPRKNIQRIEKKRQHTVCLFDTAFTASMASIEND